MTPTDPRILALADALAAMHKRATEAETSTSEHARRARQDAWDAGYVKGREREIAASEQAKNEAADLRAKLTAAEERAVRYGVANADLQADAAEERKRAEAAEREVDGLRAKLETAMDATYTRDQANRDLMTEAWRALGGLVGETVAAAAKRVTSTLAAAENDRERIRGLLSEAITRAEAAESRLAEVETAAFERGRAAGAEFAGSFAPAESRGAGASDEEMAREIHDRVAASRNALRWSQRAGDERSDWIAAVASVIRPRLAESERLLKEANMRSSSDYAEHADRARADERKAWQEATEAVSPEAAKGRLDMLVRDAERALESRRELRSELAALKAELETVSANYADAREEVTVLYMLLNEREKEATATPAPAPEPTPGPRYVVVRAEEVNGRPASWFTSSPAAEDYARLCNGRPSGFITTQGPSAWPEFTHAVIDTQAAPPPPKAPAPAPGIDAARLAEAYHDAPDAIGCPYWSTMTNGGRERAIGAMRRALATVGATAPREVTAEMLHAARLAAVREHGGNENLPATVDILRHLGRVSLPAVDREALVMLRRALAEDVTLHDDRADRAIAALDAIIAAQEGK